MKIGFLAMSGVRVRDEELMALGLTLPGFVERSKVVASLPSLGLLYDLSLTPAQVDLALVRELVRLEPFGHGNPAPRFRLDGLELRGAPRLVGRSEDHLMFSVRREGRPLGAIFYRGARFARSLSARRPFSMICELFENNFRNDPRPELRVIDLQV